MRTSIGLLIILASLAACAPHRAEVRLSNDATPRPHFENAKAGNWRLRAYVADSAIEGRVSFVQPTTARIGPHTVAFGDIIRLDRSIEKDKGGKLIGAVIGGVIGLALGSFGVQFYEYGAERDCTVKCTAEIMLPAVAFSATIGTLLGAATGPSTRAWVTVWQRP